MDTNNDNGFWYGFLFAIILVAIIWGIGKSGKYEGRTSVEWSREYNYCESRLYRYKSCVEDSIPDAEYYCVT